MKAKIKVRASFDRDASEIHQTNGWETLAKSQSDLHFAVIEFDTMAEAKAYVRGIYDGNGWDSPFAEIVDTAQATANEKPY